MRQGAAAYLLWRAAAALLRRRAASRSIGRRSWGLMECWTSPMDGTAEFLLLTPWPGAAPGAAC
jgi:hypothetical protein